jgi:hypothetical protein
VSDAARHLRPVEDEVDPLLVHPDSGERLGVLSDHVQHLHDQIAGLETDVRAWRTRHANLKRDKGKEARDHQLWPEAIKLFDLWRRKCNHTRSAFTTDRFFLVLPFLGPTPTSLLAAAERLGLKENPNPYGPIICERAILGAAFDPYSSKRRNGSTKRHDDWELIFRGAGKVEEFANRAPKGGG